MIERLLLARRNPNCLRLYLMFVHEFYFSFFLLAFTAVLCLFGCGLLIDGIMRFARDCYKEVRRTEPVVRKVVEEKVTTAERVA